MLIHVEWRGVDPLLDQSNNKRISGDVLVSTFKAYDLVSNYWGQP